MVVAEIDGVVKVAVADPPANTVPFVDTEYQSIVSPAPAVAVSVTVPVPQRDALVPAGAAGAAFTVTL